MKKIIFIHGLPFNTNSLGIVERFHKILRDSLYSLYYDDKDPFHIKNEMEIVIKNIIIIYIVQQNSLLITILWTKKF